VNTGRELILDTGDNLHFGLARLMAHSAGNSNVELVVVGDDVSVPHSRGKMVGRRCLAGITLGMSFLLCFHLDSQLSLSLLLTARHSLHPIQSWSPTRLTCSMQDPRSRFRSGHAVPDPSKPRSGNINTHGISLRSPRSLSRPRTDWGMANPRRKDGDRSRST
jgi:hypothetical protein